MLHKKLLTGLVILCLSLPSIAQSIEIIPTMGWQWGGKISYYDGDVKFRDSENYGIALNYVTPWGTCFQIEYLRQPTKMDIRYWDIWGTEYETYDVVANWYQIGGLQTVEVGNLVPFAGVTLGAAYFNPYTYEIDEKVKFAVTGLIGTKIYLNDRVGIRLHARMYVPIQYAGFYIGGGTGGVNTGISGGSSFIQGELGGGLIFRLGGSAFAPATPRPTP